MTAVGSSATTIGVKVDLTAKPGCGRAGGEKGARELSTKPAGTADPR